MDKEMCSNCGRDLTGKYCSNCGQKRYTEHDKDLKAIAEEIVHFTTHFEGTFFNTLKAILLHPGRLTVAYCAGIRKKYYKPISFFLLLIVIYLLFPVMQGLNMQMMYYKSLPLSGDWISSQIENLSAARGISESQLAELFHHKSEKMAKLLLPLLIPLTAFALRLLYVKRKKPFFDDLIAGTEINNFIILIYFLISPLILSLARLVWPMPNVGESELLAFYFITFFVYITVFLRRVFGDAWLKAFGKGLLFALLYAVITQIIYKTILFELTFALV